MLKYSHRGIFIYISKNNYEFCRMCKFEGVYLVDNFQNVERLSANDLRQISDKLDELNQVKRC